MDTIVFDLDDTLVVEKESAWAALRVACELAHERVNVVIVKSAYLLNINHFAVRRVARFHLVRGQQRLSRSCR